MGSSAQNSSGVHWCRHRVRFNEVPEKVPKVPEKVWEALVQNAPVQAPGQVQRGSGEGSEGSGEGLGGFGTEPGFLRRLRRRCGRLGATGSGAEPGDAQQGSGEGSGEPGEVQQDLRPYIYIYIYI